MNKILALDGGGVKGVLTARILQAIEEKAGKPCKELFDTIIGVSTGGLIAAGLSIFSAKELVSLCIEHSKDIFPKSTLRQLLTGFNLWGAKYSRKGIDTLLTSLFNDRTTREISYKLIIPIFDILNSKVLVIDSKILNFYLKDIVGATTAAETFFAPKEVLNEYFSDAGIVINAAETLALLEEPLNSFLLSIGTGWADSLEIKTKDTGIIGWLAKRHLIDNIINATMQFDSSLVKILMPNRIRIEPIIPLDIFNSVDNCDNIPMLFKIAEDWIASNDRIIDRVCEELLKK